MTQVRFCQTRSELEQLAKTFEFNPNHYKGLIARFNEHDDIDYITDNAGFKWTMKKALQTLSKKLRFGDKRQLTAIKVTEFYDRLYHYYTLRNFVEDIGGLEAKYDFIT